MRDKYNIIPLTFACGLHLILFTTMILAFDRSDANIPSRPLVIKAALIKEDNLLTPQKKIAQEKKEAEQKKREADVQAEKIRVKKKKDADVQAEKIRVKKKKEAEVEKKKQAKLKKIEERKQKEEFEKKEALAKQRKEEELEQRRVDAEQERLNDINRQRAENEKKRNELEEAERKAQLDRELSIEQNRLEALRSGALTRYTFALGRKIENNWIQPASADKGISCVVNVRQLPGGEVISVAVETCNGDESVRRSVEAAVYKASPLPDPEDPSLFERNLRFIFEPYQ
jgi:colicin import membrane protein